MRIQARRVISNAKRSLKINSKELKMSLPIIVLLLPVIIFGNINCNIKSPIPSLEINSKSGGSLNGSKWSSQSLEGKQNIVLYTTLKNRTEVHKILHRIDSLDQLYQLPKTTLIFNIAEIHIPVFLVKKMISVKRDDFSITIEYVIDKNKLGIKKWNLKDDSTNVLILNKNNELIFYSNKKITDSYLDSFQRKLMSTLKKSNSKIKNKGE